MQTKRVLSLLIKIILFILLTIITQIGGIVYLLNRLLYKKIKKINYNFQVLKTISFIFLYSIVSFLIVPFLAKPLGRVPLSINKENNIQPQNLMTCLLNRNYVAAELKQTLISVSEDVNKKFPNTTINFLDANFPFINSFPLIPHLSHNDGKKIDIAFCYNNARTNFPTNNCPSIIGYGVYEEPKINEVNTAELCNSKGYWQYSLLQKIVPQHNKSKYIFNEEKTKFIINSLCNQKEVSKIFIEPHLKNRMQLTNHKIRFHGCHAVRHDDHIHFQIH